VAILLAGLNAFAEETYYRAAMLSMLTGAVGRTQALLLSCVFFGLAHWLYGSPPGLVGFALTAFLAFLLGKSMLETRGMFWAWIMHFVPDVFIFFSYAMTWN
jgi:membrane protease YdiL (CAAX protease family)